MPKTKEPANEASKQDIGSGSSKNEAGNGDEECIARSQARQLENASAKQDRLKLC